MVFDSIKKFNIYNETNEDLKKEKKYIKSILKHAIKEENLKNIYFNVIIVDNKTIHEINKQYRNIDRPTDVISFALEDEKKEIPKGKRILGDIYISIDKAREQAKEYKHSLTREICFLSVHGLLHLLGYDHMKEKDEKIMFKKQEMILNGKRFTNVQEK